MSRDDDPIDPGRIAPARVEEIRRSLLRHYDSGKRDLPWRGETDPYRVWISEVMLQQTRVDSVIPYYRNWVRRFPTLGTLADAEEEEVLRLWQGLGYYSRARRLLAAARLVREQLEGAFPRSVAELERLPGVGEYTAGAVASIAFGEVAPAVDGNARRALSRLFDLPHPSPRILRRLAAQLVDPDRPGDFNQALMELGATVCVPRDPACEVCPLHDPCGARARGNVDERPPRRKRKAVPHVEMAVLVAVAGRRGRPGRHFLLRKRGETGLLAGMWEFPGTDLVVEGRKRGASSAIRDAATAAVEAMAREMGMQVVGKPSPLSPVDHVFSHLKVCYRPSVVSVRDPVSLHSGAWVRMDEVEGLPLSVAQQKIATAARRALDETA